MQLLIFFKEIHNCLEAVFSQSQTFEVLGSTRLGVTVTLLFHGLGGIERGTGHFRIGRIFNCPALIELNNWVRLTRASPHLSFPQKMSYHIELGHVFIHAALGGTVHHQVFSSIPLDHPGGASSTRAVPSCAVGWD